MMVLIESVVTIVTVVLSIWYFTSKRASWAVVKGLAASVVILTALRFLAHTLLLPLLALVGVVFQYVIIATLIGFAGWIIFKFAARTVA